MTWNNFGQVPPNINNRRKLARMDAETVYAKLRQYSREPFQATLAEMFAAMPDGERLAEWATEYPDRFFAALGALSRMSGFSDKLEIDQNLTLDVSGMSDSQLEAALADRLAELDRKAIPVEAVDVAAERLKEPEEKA